MRRARSFIVMMSTGQRIGHELAFFACVFLATCSSLADEPAPGGGGTPDNIAVIQKDTTTGFSNAGWKYDRYQDLPAAYRHEPLPPLEERRRALAHTSREVVDLDQMIAAVPLDASLVNSFDMADDVKRVTVSGCFTGTHPFWIDTPAASSGHPGNPNPGRRGILAVHPLDATSPAVIIRKIAVPKEPAHTLQLVVSGDPFETPGKSDFLLDVGIHDGTALHWFATETIDAGTPPSADNWRTFDYALAPYAGQTISVVVKVSYGGPHGVCNEEAFFDEISVK
ncbi:MAG: hypothetical protein ACYC3X_18640 [Pirellulaceae bacterium]